MTRIPLFERLQIESQSNCNRSCWFCPRTYDASGKYLDAAGGSVLNQMPTEKLLELLDQAQAMGFRGRVGFHHYSEPLLDKRNIMFAEEAAKRGMKPYLHTNGDVLKHDARLSEQVTRVYGLIVVGLYDYRTNEELASTKRYWQERLAGATLEFCPIGPGGAGAAYSIGISKALVPSDSRMLTPDLTFPNAPCHRPLIRMIVQHDGKMCHCCEDTCGAFQLGSVYEASLEELWFSDRHVGLVEDLVAGKRAKYPLCRKCPQSPTGPHPNGERIEIVPRRQTAKDLSVSTG